MNKVKDMDELNKSGFAGFFFVESENLWGVRLDQNCRFVAIPHDVLTPNKEPGMNPDELIGKLFRKGYYTEGNILIEQSKKGEYHPRIRGF
ncbi:MAG: hypothetical protein U9Q37_02840 [Euryarchaeota archaeon]|nr:hypothetical protein [Euryarchaeota archaeon]